MSSERWQRVADIFEAVLDHPTEKRQAALEASCAGDTDLRHAVQSLLDAENEAEDFMEEPVVSGPGEAVRSSEDLMSRNRRVGSYRLLRRIGQGGMSTVFLALRADEEFRRRVALKIIRRGMDSEDALRRLRTERQILASLHHPNVAELYDGGTTSEGLPYFVMEYVDGRPIDEHCDQHQLTVRQRIELFRKVCEAVHYAHQNLVVHRDIKPSNILVTADGTLKLLDFGIAKILNPDLVSSEIEPTATWMRLMTPHYASPEQVRGERITMASDVYSLGVLLYQLLTGKVPHTFEGRTPQQIERDIVDKEPTKPSTAVIRASKTETPEQLRQQLEGDLDMIVLKTLRTAPQHRYSSVEALSEDLDRYVNSYPVHARQGNLRYRTGKFLRRNWIPVLVASVIVGVIFALAVIQTIQSAAIARERDQAQRERDEKEQVLSLVQDIFKLADPDQSRGESFTVREALDKSASGIERRLTGQPAVEAALRFTIGKIYLNLGLLEQAEPHLEEVLRIRRELYSEHSPEVAEALTAVGAVLREKGEYDSSQALFEQAIDLLRETGGDDNPNLIEPLNNLLVLLCYRGHYDVAREPSLEALTLARKHLDPTRSELAQAVTNRAVVLRQSGDLVGAEEMYREALKLQRSVSGSDHPVVADILNNLAVILRRQGNFREAEQFHRDTLELRRKLYGDEHFSVAQSLANLASVRVDQGRLAAAEEDYLQALEILKSSLGKKHPVTVLVTVALASLLIERGDPPAAESLLVAGLSGWRLKLGERHALVGWAESALGGALAAQRRFEEAETLLKRGLETLEDQYGHEHERTVKARKRTAELYESWGLPDKATEYRSGH